MASANKMAQDSCVANCDMTDMTCKASCANVYGAHSRCTSGVAGCPPGNKNCSVVNGKCVKVRNGPQQAWLQAFNAASTVEEGLAVACDDDNTSCTLSGVDESVLFATGQVLDLTDYDSVTTAAAQDVANFTAALPTDDDTTTDA